MFQFKIAIKRTLREKIPNVKYEVIKDTEHNYLFFKEKVPKIISFLVSVK